MSYCSKVLVVVALTIFIDTFIEGIIVPVFPIYIEQLHASSFHLGIIFSMYPAALLLVAIPLGIMSDRQGRKKLMVIGMLGLTISTVAYAFSKSVLALASIRFLQGAAAAASWTIGPALIADIFPPEKRGEKLGLAMVGMNFGFLTGPVAGGFLYDWGGYAFPFWVCALMSAVVLLLVILVIKEPQQKKYTGNNIQINDVFGNKLLLLGTGLVIAASIGLGFMDPLLPGYYASKFAATPGTIGLLFGTTAASSIIAQPVFGRLSDRCGRIPLITAGLITTAITIPLLTYTTSIPAAVLVMGILGITYGLIFAPSGPLLADAVMGDKSSISYGAAFGLYNTAFSLGYVFGPLIGGGWVEIWSLESLLLVYSAVLLMYVAVIKKAACSK
ncbi:multidrug resistance protein [Desulfohalotomaculum tongense]|uniref:MFS transporter n=1 Tax=Desulforadius tongensis TaxID=1216062 RepID=UPI00195AE989|nr:MFS transporter [Desulforadius tongensis]MBM7854001.1 multidrug resistance protein [Desulforadius tongensis]